MIGEITEISVTRDKRDIGVDAGLGNERVSQSRRKLL